MQESRSRAFGGSGARRQQRLWGGFAQGLYCCKQVLFLCLLGSSAHRTHTHTCTHAHTWPRAHTHTHTARAHTHTVCVCVYVWVCLQAWIRVLASLVKRAPAKLPCARAKRLRNRPELQNAAAGTAPMRISRSVARLVSNAPVMCLPDISMYVICSHVTHISMYGDG